MRLIGKIRVLSPIEAFEEIVMHHKLGMTKESVAYLQAIHEHATNFTNKKSGDLRLFIEWWDESGAKKPIIAEMNERTIEIMTIHRSKGLERKVVIIPYCSWERGPSTRAMTPTTIWAEERGGSSNIIFPVTYKEEMANSAFAEAYHTERLYAHMDSLNTLYVALTRAVDSLHIFTKATTTKKEGYKIKEGIGRLIVDAIPNMPTTLNGKYSKTESLIEDRLTVVHQFGTPTFAVADVEEDVVPTTTMSEYKNSPVRLGLHMPNKRYIDERGDGEMTPIELGIKMHKIFEISRTREEIFENAQAMVNNGQINTTEHQNLIKELTKSLEHERAKEWFEGDWEAIRNESSIITSTAEGLTRRPDRVMIAGDRAVVVDYKFGGKKSNEYKKQMKHYTSLLKNMGYRTVEGYIWYILQNNIVEVE